MKNRVCLLLVSLLFGVITIIAQEVPTGLTNAFKRGDAKELSSFMGDKVEIILINNTQEYDKQDAQKTMAAFFTANKVSDFSVNHKGQRDSSSFIVGTLITSNGKFRINCFFKKMDNQYLIHQIRIDKNNE